MGTACGKCRNRRRGSHARGFTLLEILLTTMLSATLLGVLWGLFSVYLRLFETGPARTEQVQLARALGQQLCDDLHGAIEDSAIEDGAIEDSAIENGPIDDPQSGLPGAAGGSTPVRRFGLFGTQRTLQFDVLEVVPPEESPGLRGDVTDALGGVPLQQVPELRTIFYTFTEPSVFEDADRDAPADRDPEARPGLTRRELDYETPYADAEAPSTARRSPGAAAARPGSSDDQTSADSFSDDLLDPGPQDGSTVWAPEVVGLEFRYFDGSGFSSEWNSLQRKSLPVAVEVTMQLRSFEEPRVAHPVADEIERDQEEPDFEDALDRVDRGELAPETAHSSIHRFLINLPTARKRPGLRRPARLQAARSQPARAAPPPPLAVPGPLTIKRAGSVSAPAAKPDQWIRTGP